MTDSELKQLIESELWSDDPGSSQAVKVSIENGAAILRRSIGSFRRKLATHQIVGAYPGIHEVCDELVDEPIQSLSNWVNQITKKVRLSGRAERARANTRKESFRLEREPRVRP